MQWKIISSRVQNVYSLQLTACQHAEVLNFTDDLPPLYLKNSFTLGQLNTFIENRYKQWETTSYA